MVDLGLMGRLFKTCQRCPCARHFIGSLLVLVQPRKPGKPPNMTEKLLTGSLSILMKHKESVNYNPACTWQRYADGGMSCDILTYLLSVSLVCAGISVLGFLLFWFPRATFVQYFIHTQLTNPVLCGPGVCPVIFWPTSSLCLLSALASLSLDFFSSDLPELPLFRTLFTHS